MVLHAGVENTLEPLLQPWGSTLTLGLLVVLRQLSNAGGVHSRQPL
jgi:hypothetical protein